MGAVGRRLGGIPGSLVLSCLIHAVAGRTFPAGERGSAAGSLLSSHYPNYTWACVLCRPSPELPFHFVWFLGWSTTPSKVATRLLSGRKRRDGIRTARYVIARHWHLALECSFCNHVYHNTAQCIKAFMALLAALAMFHLVTQRAKPANKEASRSVSKAHRARSS